MKIRQKFFVLSGIVGVIIAVMSCVGYYTAYTNLERSVEGELSATVGAEAQGLDGWIHGKANYAVAAATIMPTVGNRGAVPQMQELLKMVASDKEVVGLVNATEAGTFVSAKKDNTGKVNPQERGWYKQAKAANGKLSFTEVTRTRRTASSSSRPPCRMTPTANSPAPSAKTSSSARSRPPSET